MNRTEAIQWMLDDPENRQIRMVKDYEGRRISDIKTYRVCDYSVKDTYEGYSLQLTPKNDKAVFEKVPTIKEMTFADAFYVYQSRNIPAENIKSCWDDFYTFADFWSDIPKEAYDALWEVKFDNV